MPAVAYGRRRPVLGLLRICAELGLRNAEKNTRFVHLHLLKLSALHLTSVDGWLLHLCKQIVDGMSYTAGKLITIVSNRCIEAKQSHIHHDFMTAERKVCQPVADIDWHF